MIVGYHRIVLAARDPLDAAVAYGRFLGREPLSGAAGAASFALANLTLAIRQAGPQEGEGLAQLPVAVRDLDDARRLLDRRGAATRLDGDEAVVDQAASHGPTIALAQEEARSASSAGDGGIDGLDHLVVRTAAADRAIALYGARLGLDFRLDRTNPAWGARLLFFRCGDAVLEIAVDAATAAPAGGSDRLSGLAWRARDPGAVNARLAAEGLEVSGLRAGRKPGTQVFTLRAGVVAAPSLVIGS